MPDSNASLLGLAALVPDTDNEQHRLYADELFALLNDDIRRARVWNIALTGGYGSGKSSVLAALRARLAAVRKEHRIVQISLSSLSDVGVNPAGDAGAGATDLTNYIQKEIVKQLLYRERPTSVPGSRFRRISRPGKVRALLASILGGAVVAGLLWMTGWGVPLALAPSDEGQRPVILIAIGLGVAAVLFASQLLFQIRWRLDKIGTASTSVSLDAADTGTYFDEYLDEIVYFFEMTRCDIVIIEDLDRFEDPTIYASLRELNTLLNASGQLRAKPVHFIYAVRDSIFEDLEDARRARARNPRSVAHPDEMIGVWQADAKLAEPATQRTKFFELVIPIVPFITHRSAADLLARMMKEIDPEVNDNAIRVVAKHVTDMRLLRNIANEYLVFRSRVLGPNAPTGLTKTGLFALVAYKNTHLEDFEEIRVGNSNLDTIYRRSRRIINEGLDALGLNLDALEASRAQHPQTHERAELLGSSLQVLVERWLSAANRPPHHVKYVVANDDWATERVRTSEFWELVIDGNHPIQIQDSNELVFTLTATSLRADLGPLLPERWRVRAQDDIQEAVDTTRNDQRWLRAADFADLVAPETDVPKIDDTSFGDWISTVTGNDPLITDLIDARLLDRNFPLYASQFYGIVATDVAMTYVLQHLQTEQPDAYYPLELTDVPAVLRLGGKHVYESTGLFNIAIYDALLGGDQRLDSNLRLLAAARADGVAFLRAYLTQGKHPDLLARRIATFWSGVFPFLETELRDRPDLLTRVAVAAFSGLDPELDYPVSPQLKDLIAHQRLEMSELTDSNLSPDRAVASLARLAMQLPSLDGLSPVATRAVITVGAYVVTAANLQVITGNQNIAVDTLIALGDGTFDHVMHHFDLYLRALDTTDSASVAFADAIVSTLTSVERAVPGRSFEIEVRIPRNLVVEDLADVPEDILAVLAVGRRFRFTFDNIDTYLEVRGLDEHLIHYLAEMDGLTVSSGVSEAERLRLANVVLNERALPIPVRLRHVARLVDAVPPTAEISSEPALVTALTRKGLLLDKPETFALLRTPESQAAFIVAAKQSPEYLLALSVPGSVAALLLDNPTTDSRITTMIADTIPQNVSWQEPDVYEALGGWIQKSAHPLIADTARLVLAAPVSTPAKAAVLGNAAPLLGYDLVAAHVATLDDNYPRLLERSRNPVDIPETPDFSSALRILQNGEAGPVSSWDPEPNPHRVWMRHPDRVDETNQG